MSDSGTQPPPRADVPTSAIGSLCLRIAPPLAVGALGAIWRSGRIVELGLPPAVLRERMPPPYVLAFWHAKLLYPLWAFRHLRPAALVSRHRNGELIARCAERLGVRCVRGASGGLGEEALLEAVRLVREGWSFGITPDGPLGPARTVKPGVVRLATSSGAPIVPLSWAARPRVRLRTWDRLEVPLPFARVAVVVGEPILAPGAGGRYDAERVRAVLEQRLTSLDDEAEAAVGQSGAGAAGAATA
jgi:hypothetical protein